MYILLSKESKHLILKQNTKLTNNIGSGNMRFFGLYPGDSLNNCEIFLWRISDNRTERFLK